MKTQAARVASVTKDDAVLLAKYPRDFKAIPFGTSFGTGTDSEHNHAAQKERLMFLEQQTIATLKKAVETKERPIFTTALIAGDVVILDMIAKAGLLDKIQIIFVDTFTLFKESISFLHECDDKYGIKIHTYHALGYDTQEEYEADKGLDFWKEDIDEYDQLCKVEPLQRALKTFKSDCWLNGRRRDHGAERAEISLWEGTKLNPLAFWTFEDCWTYLREYNVAYHPLHDVGYSSLGDVHSTLKVDTTKWMAYAGERAGRFQGLVNKDGSAKTECGIHSRPATPAGGDEKRARVNSATDGPNVGAVASK